VIACANLGNLLLARATARAREVAVRLALGASRGRLVRQLLTENLCLALAGGAAGLAVAVVLRRALVRLVSDTIALPPPVDLRVLGFAFALTVAAGLLLGLLPALRLTKIPAGAGLREQGRGIAGSATWLRVGRFVVVAQLACSVPLLVGAGLLAGTLVNLQRVDLGYDPHGLAGVRIDATAAGYDPAREAAAFDAILTRIRAAAGVRAASYSNNGLFGGIDNGDDVAVEGYVPKGDGDGASDYDAVGPGYFSTLGIPIVAGREISDADVAGGAMVCVINEAFARRFFAGRNPVGFHLTASYADQRRSYRIVGVARDSRQWRLRDEIEHRFYAPATRPASEIGTVTFLVRAPADAGRVLGDVRRLIREVEPRMALGTSGHVADAIDRRLAQDRMVAQISIVFAAVAACLAALGLYGVLSYGVARRTAEIGLRKALGAGHGAVIALIMRETGWLLAAGLVVGGALAAGAAQLIASRLYGLSPADPVTFGTAIAALGLVALVATWLPAHRASRVDPLVALRQE
jgi:predicted permease